mgnify:CR=1 FL=1
METSLRVAIVLHFPLLETKYRDIADGNIALLVVPLVW